MASLLGCFGRTPADPITYTGRSSRPDRRRREVFATLEAADRPRSGSGPTSCWRSLATQSNVGPTRRAARIKVSCEGGAAGIQRGDRPPDLWRRQSGRPGIQNGPSQSLGQRELSGRRQSVNAGSFGFVPDGIGLEMAPASLLRHRSGRPYSIRGCTDRAFLPIGRWRRFRLAGHRSGTGGLLARRWQQVLGGYSVCGNATALLVSVDRKLRRKIRRDAYRAAIWRRFRVRQPFDEAAAAPGPRPPGRR